MRKGSSSSVRIFYPKFDREEVIRILSERLPELRKSLPLLKVVLFGSYAKGNYTVRSDIDLLIVYAGEERPDAYALAKKVLNLPRLEPHVYTERQYQELEAQIRKMIEGGVVLFPQSDDRG